jgi:hypothetical protein
LLLEIKVLPWDRHKNVTGLNCNTNISIQLEKNLHRFAYNQKDHMLFTNMNKNINKDATLAE